MTERETAKIIALLREYYRDAVSTTETAKVKAWHLLLCDFEYADAERAVIELASSYKNEFMPAPARLIEILKKISRNRNARDDSGRLRKLLKTQETKRLLGAGAYEN